MTTQTAWCLCTKHGFWSIEAGPFATPCVAWWERIADEKTGLALIPYLLTSGFVRDCFLDFRGKGDVCCCFSSFVSQGHQLLRLNVCLLIEAL